MKIELWTDGSINVSKNDKCSYAFLCKLDGELIHESYDEIKSEKRTGNVAEMTAIIESLKWVNSILDQIQSTNVDVIIYTDSQYCQLGITKWIHGWKLRGYKGKQNIELWKEFYNLYYKQNYNSIKINWIKGHSGIEENERVDYLCKLITVSKDR